MSRVFLMVGDYNHSAAGRQAGGLSIYDVDRETGDVTLLSVSDAVDNPSFLAVNPARRLLAATSEVDEGSLVVFDMDPESGHVRETGRQPSLGAQPCHVSFDRTGAFLIVSNFGADRPGAAAVAVFAAERALRPALSHVVHSGSGAVHPHPDGPHAHCAVASLDNRFILVTDYGADRIYLYPFDERRGELGETADVLILPPGSAPRTIAISPDGDAGYVTAELASRILTFRIDTQRGRLSLTGSAPTRPARQIANYPAEIRISADGRYLFATNRGDETVAIFEVEGDAPKLAATLQTGGRWPRCLALSDDGRSLVVANQHSGEIVAFSSKDRTFSTGKIIARHLAPAFVGFASF
jgi:6-phosphogluconolactonase